MPSGQGDLMTPPGGWQGIKHAGRPKSETKHEQRIDGDWRTGIELNDLYSVVWIWKFIRIEIIRWREYDRWYYWYYWLIERRKERGFQVQFYVIENYGVSVLRIRLKDIWSIISISDDTSIFYNKTQTGEWSTGDSVKKSSNAGYTYRHDKCDLDSESGVEF